MLGLGVIGVEALRTIGTQGITGDLLFVAAGMLVRDLRHAAAAVADCADAGGRGDAASCRSPACRSLAAVGFDNMLAAGLVENLMQAVVQGVFAGAGATYLFTRAVVLLGAGRAALFPSLVPAFTLLIGYLALGEVPSVWQLVGLRHRAIVRLSG